MEMRKEGWAEKLGEPESPKEIMKDLTAFGLKVMRTAFYTMDKIGFLWGNQTGDPGKALLNFSHCNHFCNQNW